MILDLGSPILNYFGTFSIIFTDFYGRSSFDEISGFNLINSYPVPGTIFLDWWKGEVAFL